jgi:hypothetical protein
MPQVRNVAGASRAAGRRVNRCGDVDGRFEAVCPVLVPHVLRARQGHRLPRAARKDRGTHHQNPHDGGEKRNGCEVSAECPGRRLRPGWGHRLGPVGRPPAPGGAVQTLSASRRTGGAYPVPGCPLPVISPATPLRRRCAQRSAGRRPQAWIATARRLAARPRHQERTGRSQLSSTVGTTLGIMAFRSDTPSSRTTRSTQARRRAGLTTLPRRLP